MIKKDMKGGAAARAWNFFHAIACFPARNMVE